MQEFRITGSGPYKIWFMDYLYFETDEKPKDDRQMKKAVLGGFSRLKSKMGRNAVYIDETSGIPLIGNQYFGLIDRGSNIIELRPLTGCNLSCIYCAVDEGPKGSLLTDYFVDKDYLVKAFSELAQFKGCDDIEAHINPQGEPFLYRPLASLIRDLKAIKQVKTVSIDTNGTLITPEKLRELEDAGTDRLNISINAFAQDKADMIAGCRYDVQKVLKVLKLARIEVLLAPLIIPGYNDYEIEPIVKYALEGGYRIGVQSYMHYKGGRNPAKPMGMDDFYAYLKSLEEKLGAKLIATSETFRVHKAPQLPIPFRKGENVKLQARIPGRHANECISVARNRSIAVRNCSGRSVNAQIIRTKHNIILGVKR